MLIAHIAQKMIRESHGNLHDINHFQIGRAHV